MNKINYLVLIAHEEVSRIYRYGHTNKAILYYVFNIFKSKVDKELVRNFVQLLTKWLRPKDILKLSNYLIITFLTGKTIKIGVDLFSIKRIVGKGGQSVVYLVESSNPLEERFVIKAIQISSKNSTEAEVEQNRKFAFNTRVYKDKYVARGTDYLKEIMLVLRKELTWFNNKFGDIENLVIPIEEYLIIDDPLDVKYKVIGVKQAFFEETYIDVFNTKIETLTSYCINNKKTLLLLLRFISRIESLFKEEGTLIDILGKGNVFINLDKKKKSRIVIVDPHTIYKFDHCDKDYKLKIKNRLMELSKIKLQLEKVL